MMASFNFRWVDEYLAWGDVESAEFYRSYSVQMPSWLIWFPAITLVNSATSGVHIALADGTLVDAPQDGTVSAQLYAQLVAVCHMDLFAHALLLLIFENS